MRRSLICTTALAALQIIVRGGGGVEASPTVKIFSYDEALTEGNISKPRIYIRNLSATEAISNFYYYYYFTTENGKTPVVDDYYTPKSIPSLQSLGSGNYRIKFTFSGVTLQPGQILPNTSGEVVGIHYSDWSVLDKINDFSNNLSGTFVQNPNIPVYLYDGTLIYGNLPGDPANPPQPPAVVTAAGDYAVFSEEYTDLRDRVKITGGNVGSANYTELGCDDTLYGNALSKGNIFLRERARVYGDVTAGMLVSKQSTAYIQGTSRNYAQMEVPVLATPVVAYGTTNIPVPPGTAYTLTPGSYNSFHAYANVSLTILPGEYFFREFILEPNVTVLFDISDSERVDLNIKDNCSLGNGTEMALPSGNSSYYSINIRSAQTSVLYIGTDASIKGVIYAPDAEVHVYSRTEVAGSLYGKRVVIEPDVQLCKPPTLLGLFHSEGAMGPPFDPVVFNYVAVVPDVTSTIIVTPVAKSGQMVTVNGDLPSNPVNLTGDETDIMVLLTHPEACGSTVYKLKVKRSTDYGIYVDANSPCTTGQCDGSSWETAIKDIDPAIQIAAIEGKPVWVREGVYIPTERLDPTDPRSATFLIKPGMEIVCGFQGDETDGEPRGLAHNTIFSGDVNGDDTNFTAWPPDSSAFGYVDDNLYHVFTVVGNSESSPAYLSNLIVTHGYASGTGLNAVGGGMLVKSGKVNLEFVGFVDNYGADGPALTVCENGSIGRLKNCLFQRNHSHKGNGGSLNYQSSLPLVVDACVFDGNTTADTSSSKGGSAMYFRTAAVDLVNCVFAENKSHSVNGAVLNDGGTLNVLHCTFAFNTSDTPTGAVSVSNANGASTVMLNSILWNSNGKNEVGGNTDFTINYTCITNGHTGTHNFSSDPLFRANSVLAGADGKWGSYDDNLQLKNNSPCRGKAYTYNTLEYDILTTVRPATNVFADMGAYEYIVIEPGTTSYFGIKYGAGEFEYNNNIYVYKPFNDAWHKMLAIKSKNARYIRVLIPDNEYTSNKQTLIMYLYITNGSGIMNDIDRQTITLERGEGLNGQHAFYSDKPLVFFDDKEYVNGYLAHPDDGAYFVYHESSAGIGFRFILPASQF